MSRNELRGLLRRVLSSQGLHKVTIGVHQVKVDAVVDEVVLAGLDVLGRAEVDAVLLAQRLDLVVGSGQADEPGVELGQVLLQGCWVVARGVAGDEDGEEGRVGVLGFDNVEHLGHLVELFGADVGAAGEAEVDLQTRSSVILQSQWFERSSNWKLCRLKTCNKHTRECLPIIISLVKGFPS